MAHFTADLRALFAVIEIEIEVGGVASVTDGIFGDAVVRVSDRNGF